MGDVGLGRAAVQHRHHDLRLLGLHHERELRGDERHVDGARDLDRHLRPLRGAPRARARPELRPLGPHGAQPAAADLAARRALGLALRRPARSPAFLWVGLVCSASARSSRRSRGSTTTRRSTRWPPSRTVGRVSGFGWGMGYLGGHPRPAPPVLPPHPARRRAVRRHGRRRHGHPGLDAHLRAVDPALHDPRVPRAARPRPVRGPLGWGSSMSYRLVVARRSSGLWGTSRHTVYFLLASALFRDGLAGVFAFGADPRRRHVRAVGRRRHRLRGGGEHRGRVRDDGFRPARRPDRAEEGHPHLAGLARRARGADLHPARRRAGDLLGARPAHDGLRRARPRRPHAASSPG